MANLVPHFCTSCADLIQFAPFTFALSRRLRYANEVFDDGESNERLTKSRFLSEHTKSASETHSHLRFFVDLINFSNELAFGQTFIRFGS